MEKNSLVKDYCSAAMVTLGRLVKINPICGVALVIDCSYSSIFEKDMGPRVARHFFSVCKMHCL